MKIHLITSFTPAKRATTAELQRSMEIACMNPVMNGIMMSAGGPAAVLNHHRQILTVNDAFLEYLGVNDGGGILGLRLGEALRCIHAREMPGGCCTSSHCHTCEASLAVEESMRNDSAAERKCAITVLRNGKPEDICLQVRACPFPLEGQRLILLFLKDITTEEWRAALERVFFHDVNTTLQSLLGMSFLMDYMDDRELREMVKPFQLMSWRIAREVKIQNALSGKNVREYRPELQEIMVLQIIEEMRSIFASHPVAAHKRLSAPKTVPVILIRTDPSLLSRILIAMLKNAFEATDYHDEVRIWVEEEDESITFFVWNRQPVSGAAALRIFQRHFSTKDGPGRGFGTYLLKLFGEGILKGKVDFTSSSQSGTVFRLKLPREISG
jgi:hypothetical protein